MTYQKRFFLSGTIIALITIFICYFFLSGGAQIEDKIDTVVRVNYPAQKFSRELSQYLVKAKATMQDAMESESAGTEFNTTMSNLKTAFDESAIKLGAISDEHQLRQTAKLFARYIDSARNAIGAVLAGSDDVAAKFGVINDISKQISDTLAKITKENEELLSSNLAASIGEVQGFRTWVLVLSLVLLSVLAFCGFWLVRGISRPLVQMASVANELAIGKLDQNIDITTQDEFGVLARSLQDMISAQQKMAAVAKEIARGNLEVKIETLSDQDVLGISMINMKERIQGLVKDTYDLLESTLSGNLSVRVDTTSHQGDYKRIVQGINDTLDAILTPVDEAALVLGHLADCDLRSEMKGDYKGDHARIKNSVNQSTHMLHDAMLHVSQGAEQVLAAASQIATSSQQVAQGASQQASSLEETSSALEEMASMTKQNADNTNLAKQLAIDAKQSADKGSEAMIGMNSSMDQIREAAESTAQIIKDINEIAFQTNLLALNAAVEAARAGDAGRGFAVVAEEVRNLALRSKEAAMRTEELITKSVNLADQGGSISKSVCGGLEEIVNSVGKVNNLVMEIAAASDEQARGIQQVNEAISRMDGVVQQAAANSEESSSAAQELSSQAQELTSMVGRFQLNRRSNRSSRHRPNMTEHKKIKPSASRAMQEKREFAPEEIIPLPDNPDLSSF